MFVICMLIYIFETKIRKIISLAEILSLLELERIDIFVDTTICDEEKVLMP